jgi:RNA polymerase-binding transcription factor
VSAARQRLEEALAQRHTEIAALERERARMVAASEDSNADDEHDPEGSTIAFEREQLTALLERARRAADELAAALSRLAAGDYGRCLHCGGPIGDERLAARPGARQCIDCARRS